ncbi:MAG: PilN domain-containing protein [Candidatus Babeliales bacterium]
MKEFNLIKTLSPQKKQRLIYWLYLTIIAFVLIFSLITIYAIHGIYSLWQYKTKYRNLKNTIAYEQTLLNEIKSFNDQHSILKKKLAKIDKFLHKPANPCHYLQIISSLIPEEVALTTYKQEKKSMQLEGHAFGMQQVIAFSQALKTTDVFDKIQLTSLTHQASNKSTHAPLRFVIKGTIKKNFILS